MKKEKESLQPPDYFYWVTNYFSLYHSPREKIIIARLRDRHKEMKSVYSEIHRKLFYVLPLVAGIAPEKRASPVMQAIIGGAIRYGHQEQKVRGKLQKVYPRKESQKALKKSYSDIAKTTKELIELLDRFEKEQTKGPMTTEADFDIFNLIEKARSGNILYDEHIRPLIDEAQGYDDRYYPSIQEILKIILQEIAENKLKPMYPEDVAVFRSREPSRIDFMRYFHEVLKTSRRTSVLPAKFNLSPENIRVITECALGLEKDSIKDVSSVVKALSNRKRNISL